MIISHKHKFIFIKTKKTAGTTFEMALSNICGSDDIIAPHHPKEEKIKADLGIRTAQNYHIPISKWSRKHLKIFLTGKRHWPRFYGHDGAEKIKQFCGDEVWNTYYKFCFERNPYDKFISWYYYSKHLKKSKVDSVDEFLKTNRINLICEFDKYAINNQVVVDDVYKFEELEKALLDVSNKLNLKKPLVLPDYKAKGGIRSDRRHYTEVLTKEQIQVIDIAFAREFKLLGY